ncbi:hypothetical protein [Streptomyces sp. NBC_01176]|uniref:hypothetical protein n=1 Tax=Streptomyces sp. NBC_01176 TaxID=2903760 RepID=UPI003869AFED|nr:hypothetical protein OG199_37730 [Streptomyces sp. NBC_01176]
MASDRRDRPAAAHELQSLSEEHERLDAALDQLAAVALNGGGTDGDPSGTARPRTDHDGASDATVRTALHAAAVTVRGTVSDCLAHEEPKKLERILHNPQVSLAYHTREHGFAASSSYVLAQGTASVDLRPSRERLAELMRASVPFLGETRHGPLWDWLLREYHQERVFVDVELERVAVWEDLAARGARAVTGTTWPQPPREQTAPKNGTGPRLDVTAVARRIRRLPHRLLAYRGADGFPVIVPVRVTGHDGAGLHLDVPRGLLPPGGRRAGFLAHAFEPQCVGLGMRTLTGWVTVTEEGTVYAPHTSKGLAAPPFKNLLTVSNGLLAKYGLWRARRDGTSARLQDLVVRGPAE